MTKLREEPESRSDFSLVLGGPFYQVLVRSLLAKPPLAFLRRRLLFFPLFTWFIPMILSSWEGTVLSGVAVPFLHDIVMHARFLIALPLFLIAELFVHERIKPLVQLFIDRQLIADSDRPRFNSLITSAMRLRNSWVLEGLLLVLCVTLGHSLWVRNTSLTTTWYMTSPQHPLTLAGNWYAWVSMPIFQFMYLRWMFRWFIWARFLWQVSRFRLQLMPTHPDRAGGLGFLTESAAAFSPVIAAQGAVLAGIMAGKIFFDGASLVSFKLDILSIALVQIALVLGPLCVFAMQLAAARRRGLKDYGNLSMHYMGQFDQKWISGSDSREKLLGTSDIQSLADMGNSYNVIREMQVVPFGREAILKVALATLIPIAPLVLTIVPLDQLISKLLGIPF